MNKVGRNDPCPCGSGKKYKHCHLGRTDDPALLEAGAPPPVHLAPGTRLPAAAPEFALPPSWGTGGYPGDARGDEDDWDDEEIERGPMTPEEEAWALVDTAFDGPPAAWPKEAKAALRLYPRCSGAVYLQAKWEQDEKRQLALFNQAIALADEELGPGELARLAPGDWLDPHVEYGMIARSDRAMLLVAEGELDEAVAALDELERLDPSDRLGVVTRRMIVLLSLDRAPEALAIAYGPLKSAYDDETFAYARALAAYQTYGDTIFARRALAEAMIVFPDGYGTLAELLSVESEPEPGPETVETREPSEDELEAIAGDLVDEIGHDPTGPEIEELLNEMFGLFSLVTVWGDDDGATAWLHAVRAAGPAVQTGIVLDPRGPALFVAGLDTTRPNCHACGHRLRASPLALVVDVEPDDVLVIPGKLRECTHCGTLNIGMDALIDALIAADPERLGRDFIPVGVVTASATGAGNLAAGSVHAVMQRLADLVIESEEETEWPTEESQQQTLDTFITRVESLDLFGPVGPIDRDDILGLR